MKLTEADVALLEQVDLGNVIRVWPRDEDIRTFPRLRVRARVEQLRKQKLVYLPPKGEGTLSTAWCLSERGVRVLARAHDLGMGVRSPDRAVDGAGRSAAP